MSQNKLLELLDLISRPRRSMKLALPHASPTLKARLRESKADPLLHLLAVVTGAVPVDAFNSAIIPRKKV